MGTDGLTDRHIFSRDSGISSHSFGRSYKDNLQINMPDGDEIDDIEEASVDYDSPHPRNRQRLSC